MLRGGVKIFRDNVHGYIKVPKLFVKYFIDTEIFQRLRFIEQTGMRTLYPSARHDRFIHSLGTFYLGQKAYEDFKNNVKSYYSENEADYRNHYKVFPDSGKNEKFWEMCGILFSIACLLHDCGHAPFSHTLEFIYIQEERGSSRATLNDKLIQYLNTEDFLHDFGVERPGSEHEKMSALVVCTEYVDKIEKIVEVEFPEFVDSQDSLEFICRMIIGCTYQVNSRENQIKNCFINLLNSKSIDVDSLDYIIRDSKLSGIDNMTVDVERLLSSLTIVERTVFDNIEVNTEVRTNILKGKLISTSSRKASINALCRGTSHIHAFDGKMDGKLTLGGVMRFAEERNIDPKYVKTIRINGGKHKKIVSTDEVERVELDVTLEKSIEVVAQRMDLEEQFNGLVNGKADSIEFTSTYVEGRLKGIFSGNLLGNYASAGGVLKCELGFHKSSLSVIQNVVSARNYEYQWIYSHHKVVYYSNFLIIELLKKSIKYLLKSAGGKEEDYEAVMTSILSWETMIKESGKDIKVYDFIGRLFFRTNDSDLVSLFKQCYLLCLSNKDKSDSFSLLAEYFTRNYRKSIWKSYAEYCIFFSDLSDNEKTRLYDLIRSKTIHGVDDKYGYFADDWSSRFLELGFNDVIWVNGNSKLKRLDPDNTFILFKDNPLNLRSVSLEKDLSSSQQINLFYIYYNSEKSISETSIKGLKAFLKAELIKFIK